MAAVAKDLDQVQEEALGENGIHDMINMNKLTEDTILRNIQKRFGKNIIYTNIGAILVAMNPYQVLPIYTQKAVEAYVGKQLGALPPHIFATADSAFRAMGEMRKNQAIIISGDSGSGKTETTKLILQYLASMTQKHSEVEQMILETSPILESFGNAKTVRNNNSSRFGKFMEIHFDKDQRICGCKISQYLLEKSRIVFQAQNERNFHIFYQLCAGATDDEKARWMLKEPSKFSYLNQSGCVEINGVDDSENFDRTRFALTLLGMNEDVQDEIFAILAAVLHLGDIRFAAAGEGSKVVDMVPVENAAKLLKIDSKQLAYLLCNRNLTIRGTTTAVLLNPKLAESSRDALAKILYKRLFEWLVARINTAILKPGKQFFIGVLDIFGFENFKINSFEQFCIDYANEKLQQHFNHALFKLEQEEYDKESINWSKIAFKDNSECIDLIEKPNPPGIISILDEESRFPKATDLTFLDKLSQKFNTHNHFAKPKLAKSSFIVKHYAGDVEYQVENFLDKNKDTVTEDMLAMLVAAKVGTVQAIFKSDADEAKQQSANRRTIATQFRTNLAELMTTLSSCHAFYVRCIKPNGLQQAVTFDQDMVLAQLRYTGMMDTIRIRKLGYPIRWPLFEFYRRYEILVPNSKWDAKDPRGVSNTLLNKLALTPDNWQLGKTKVFLRDKEYAALEARRNERIAKTVLIIQSWWKMMMLRLRFKQMRRSAVIIQKHVRRHRLRKRFVAQRAAVKTLQATIRMAKTRKAQMPRLIEHKKKMEEERKKRIEDERRRKEAAEKAAKDREEQLLREELERRKREKEEGASFAKEEERRKKEAEKAAKEAAKEAEKAAKEAEKNKKKGGKSDPGADGETAAEEEDDEVDPSWDMLRGAGSGPGSGSPSAGPSPVAGTSPSKADNPRSGTLSRSLKLEQDSSTGVKTLRATGMGDGLGTMRMGTMTLRRKHGKPITTIPAAPQIQKSGTETWVDFALRYFQGGSAAPKQGTATLKRNTKPSSPSEAMAYQNKAIKESLLPLKFELQKLAVQIFSKLLLYLENGPPSKPGKSDKWLAVQFVQHQGITVPDVRDEIYCQIIKLTYQNTNKTELPRAWQLLVFMIAVFLPSPTLLPYLSNYITTNMNKKDEISQIAEYANRALNRSHANKIRRQQPCSHAELDVLRRLEMMEIAFDVPGGTQYKIKLDSSTQVGEVIALLAAKREIPDPVGYAVYEVYDKTARLEQSLGVYDYIADSYGKSEVKSMVFKKKLWLHRNELPDTYGEHKMISNQLREDTVDGSFPLTEVELLTLTAYLLQVKLSKKKSATDPVKFDLKRHLPSHLIRKYTAEQWKNQLFAKHTELKLEKTPKRECKRLYIEFAMKTPHYGTTYFPMETDLKMNPLGFPAKCYIGVNSEGVHVCNYNDVRSIIKSFYFTEIEVWSYQYRTKLFYNDGKKQIQTEFNSTRGPELASLSKDYVFWLRLESQYAQCISDYDPGDDPNLLPMKVGDLVFITEKDEEAGWYIGESNDRAGSFPIAHVEVLITVPDTLAKMFAGAAGKQDPKAARMSFRKSGVAGGIEKDARSPASAVPKHLLNEGAAAAGKRDSGTLGALSGRLSVNLNAAALGPGGKTDYRKSIMQRKQQYNPASYTFEAYAKAQFMSTQSIAKEITFSSAPIKQPLVTGIDAPLYKNAVTTFTTIMKFMDDFPEKGKQRPTDLLRILFEEAIDHPQLRDEIYAQLMKQTNENGNQGHCVKGWELMAICARIFLPTEKLLPYLMAYFVNAINNKDKRPQEGALAETALTRLEVTQLGGGRTHIPSMKEIDSMLSGASIKVDVYLSDGFKRTIDIDTATIVGEVISELLKQAKLPYRNTWGLCEVISARDYDKDRALKATDNLCEIINSWRFIKPPKGVEALDFKLVYKKVIFLSERDPDLTDPRFEQLMYHQCVYNIISCKQPTVEDEMVALAGIYLQLTKANPNSSAAKTVEEMLPDVVPTPFLLTRPKTYWVPKLQAEWAKHADKDPRALRLAYVERASQWPLFGCSRFAVQYAMTKKSVVDATLAITKEGLHLLEIYSKNPLKTWQFSQISSWTPTKSAFTIVTGNLVNPRREIFRTLEADDIAVMYKAYVDSLASASIAKARSNVVVLGS